MCRRIRQIVVVVRGLASRGKKSPKRIRQPERSENIYSRFSSMVVGFGIEKRDSGGKTVIAPYLHDMGDQLRLIIESLPGSITPVVGIVFK
jgi:hypothetical protein